MAELSPRERLQPSLLDRLTDDARRSPKAPGKPLDEQRVLSPRRLKECVIRDLEWLLNACDLASVQDLAPYPQVVESVVNFGLPALAGRHISGLEVAPLALALRQAILRFEPRILRQTLSVDAVIGEAQPSRNAIRFDIVGDIWGQPMPQRLYLKTDVDLESGNVQVAESAMPST